jgi:hypothetical protein
MTLVNVSVCVAGHAEETGDYRHDPGEDVEAKANNNNDINNNGFRLCTQVWLVVNNTEDEDEDALPLSC